MTIFFNGHAFKYEIEGVCKLFLPLLRFDFQYDALPLEECRPQGDYLYTLRREGAPLSVQLSLQGRCSRMEAELPPTGPDFETECERRLCVLIYRLLSQALGIRPGWGILTGVRPVALVQRERKAGRTQEEILRRFQEQYLVSEEKLRLALHTADVQSGLLADFPERSYSLYVSIPFCASRCSYCSFVSHAITARSATDKIDEYLDKLRQELAYTARLAERLGLRLDTIYIGGGTPTALTAGQLRQVTDAVGQHFPAGQAREYTIEAGRADTITPEKLQVIWEAGADRISVNPQTFNDEVLRRIGRRHTAQQAVEAYRLAREAGFPAINMDFIAGLPGDTPESFRETIDQAIRLAPENITVHTLSIKRSADLFSEEGIQEYVRTASTGEMTEYARSRLMEAGYRPYYLYRQKNSVGNLENVGYSLPGRESLYNVYIMDEIQTILACGAGGSTKLVGVEQDGRLPIQRIFNYKYHFEYIDHFDEVLRRKDQAASFLQSASPGR